MTDTSETILMSKDSSGRWTFTASLKSEPMLTIHHGVKSCKMKIKTIGQTHHTYILDQKMFEELNVPITLMEYRIKQVHPGEWILGPFVGIFTSENLLQKLLSQEDITVYDDYSKILERNQGLAVFSVWNVYSGIKVKSWGCKRFVQVCARLERASIAHS